jgi:hypothetical protein
LEKPPVFGVQLVNVPITAPLDRAIELENVVDGAANCGERKRVVEVVKGAMVTTLALDLGAIVGLALLSVRAAYFAIRAAVAQFRAAHHPENEKAGCRTIRPVDYPLA